MFARFQNIPQVKGEERERKKKRDGPTGSHPIRPLIRVVCPCPYTAPRNSAGPPDENGLAGCKSQEQTIHNGQNNARPAKGNTSTRYSQIQLAGHCFHLEIAI